MTNKVPGLEIENRVIRLQSVIKSMELDGVFIMQNVDIFYFSGTIQTSVLFIPDQGQPVMMALKSIERAKDESPLEQIIPIESRQNIPDVLADLGIGSLRSVGLEIDVLPAYLYLWFRNTFKGCNFVDVSCAIRKVRMIKSLYEIDQIRAAASILHKGFVGIAGIIREGMTELEIDGHLGLIARKEGHMGIMRMRGWNQEMTYAHVLSGDSGSVISFLNSPQGGTGTTPAMAQGAGFRKVRRNEPIEIDYGAGMNGYLADQSRTFVIGKLSKELERAHDCSKHILSCIVQKAKPGILCSELYHLAVEKAAENGYKDVFMGYGEGKVKFIGHGVGLEIDEFPLLAPHFDQELMEGMVIAIEPKFVFPGKGVVGLEDVYLVTGNGLERLTLTEQKLMVIHI